MKKGKSWRYTPKIDRSWLEDESAKPETPEVYSEDEGATLIEPPAAARVEMEQLSERVRNMGEVSVPPTQEYVPDIKAEPEVKVPANEQVFVPPVQAAAPVVTVPANEQIFTPPVQAVPVVTPPAAATFVPPVQPNYVRPNIPVQPAFKPNIPAVPPTQRIAERLAQQRHEAATRPFVPPIEAQPAEHEAVPASGDRPFYPESYIQHTTSSQPTERVDKVFFAPTEIFKPAEPVQQPVAPSAAVVPPAPPAPPEPVAEKIEVPEAPAFRFTAPVPAPTPFRPEIPAEPKFERPVDPKVEPKFDPLFQPKIEEPVRAKIEAPAQPRYAELREEPVRQHFEPTPQAVKEAPKQAAPPPPPPPPAQRQAPPQAPPPARPRPEQRPTQPVRQREHDDEGPSGLTRVLNAVRAAIPVVQRLLPLFEGNVAKAVTNLLAPTTAIAPTVQKVDIAPVERGLLELNRQQRELREQVAAQNAGLQRVEDQLMHVRTATDRNTLEQQELIEEMQKMEKRQGRFAMIMVFLLLLSLAANALLYWQFRR